MMVFGVAPPGPLEEASVRVVESLTDTYRNAKLVTGGIERTPGGIRFLMVGGRAAHATGAPVRFLVITIQGPDENRAITVRFSAHSDPLEALPAIRRSSRPTRPSWRRAWLSVLWSLEPLRPAVARGVTAPAWDRDGTSPV